LQWQLAAMVSSLIIDVVVEMTLILANIFLYLLIQNCSRIADFDFFVVRLIRLPENVFMALLKPDNNNKLLKLLPVEIPSL
jgi:uncharacterized membrane protein